MLGALIIQALWHILTSRKLYKIRLMSPVEFWFGVLAFAGVVLIDVLQGMIIGLVASMLFVVYQSSRPRVSSLGRVPGVPGVYTDLSRHPENIPVSGVLIVRRVLVTGLVFLAAGWHGWVSSLSSCPSR